MFCEAGICGGVTIIFPSPPPNSVGLAPFIVGLCAVGGGVALTALAVELNQNSASDTLLPPVVGGGDAQGLVCRIGSGSGIFRPCAVAV